MLEAKQKRAQIARAKIIKAASKMFATQGFDGTKTEDIAKEAGVSKGTVFAHFGDKLYLLAEVGQVELDARLEYLEGVAEADRAGDAVENICIGLDRILDYFEEQPEFLRLFVEKSALRLSDEGYGFDESIRRIHRALKAIVARWNGGLDAELTAVALRAYMLHMAVGRLCGEYKSPDMRKEELRALVSGLVGGESV